MRLILGTGRPNPRRAAARSSYGNRPNGGAPRGESLRGARDEIPTLALSFLSAVAAPEGPLGFTAAAMRQLRSHRWPGGVPELRRVVEVAASVCNGDVLDEMTVAFALETGASGNGCM